MIRIKSERVNSHFREGTQAYTTLPNWLRLEILGSVSRYQLSTVDFDLIYTCMHEHINVYSYFSCTCVCKDLNA